MNKQLCHHHQSTTSSPTTTQPIRPWWIGKQWKGWGSVVETCARGYYCATLGRTFSIITDHDQRHTATTVTICISIMMSTSSSQSLPHGPPDRMIYSCGEVDNFKVVDDDGEKKLITAFCPPPWACSSDHTNPDSAYGDASPCWLTFHLPCHWISENRTIINMKCPAPGSLPPKLPHHPALESQIIITIINYHKKTLKNITKDTYCIIY